LRGAAERELMLRLLSSIVAGVVLLFLALPAEAAQPKDYSYLFVQGKLTDSSGRRGVPQTAVQLVGESGTFEAMTNRRGVFVFEKLPVASYELSLATDDGRVLLGARETPIDDIEAKRLTIRVGSGTAVPVHLEPAEGGVVIRAESGPANWTRFRRQFLIFLGSVGLLLLL